MTDKLRAYLLLHFCVFIWGFTAILGKLISLQTFPLVWWRVFLCCVVLVAFLPLRQWYGLKKRTLRRFLGIGVLVGIHWVCFYGAIKISNASVAVASMATTSFFAAFTEPFFTRQKFKWYELALGIFVLPGMALIAGNIDWTMRIGLGLGIVGAFLAAVFTALNKRMLETDPAPPLAMSLVELSGGLLVTSLALPLLWYWAPEQANLWPQTRDWLWMAILSLVCTLLPYYLTLQAMRHISAFGINLTLNLEPVYGVVLAALVFREHHDMNPRFYVGMLIILLAVFSHPFLKMIFEKNTPAGKPVV